MILVPGEHRHIESSCGIPEREIAGILHNSIPSQFRDCAWGQDCKFSASSDTVDKDVLCQVKRGSYTAQRRCNKEKVSNHSCKNARGCFLDRSGISCIIKFFCEEYSCHRDA